MDRKFQKKKRREDKLNARRKHTTTWVKTLAYPKFTFSCEADAAPGFVELVKKAAKAVDFDSLPKHYRDILTFSKNDPGVIFEQLPKFDVASDKVGTASLMVVAHKVGDLLFKTTLVSEWTRWIPYNSIELTLMGETIDVRFQSLKSYKNRFGTVYFSKFNPAICVGGQRRTIGWSTHAVEQVCERLSPYWASYGGLQCVFSFFNECLYFEHCKLPAGDDAFMFYNKCMKHSWTQLYAESTLGEKMDPAFFYYYKVGYCPVVFDKPDNSVMKALTFLCPGYSTTPERALLGKAEIPFKQKQEWLKQSTDTTAHKLIDSQDFGLIKWYHNNGLPQVVKLTDDFYVRKPKMEIPHYKVRHRAVLAGVQLVPVKPSLGVASK